ncbi:MAG: CZB domain-containing protein [Gammaproteobacteria bacterium]|nr:CZB domain-containing protein [Gammaproteobacteria bacterium]MBU1625731.1 CZB domain-containing protein [Gammaproteobacteria bacterium]MBU1980991.1 CZB domain-containing protein [Gammaproteobacteria bacterium]
MKNVSFIINLLIVFGIGVELVLILLGKLSADQLLISSALSGLVILISVKLLKDALIKLFGLTEDQKEVIKNEINVMDEIESHVAWKVALQNYLDGKSTAEFNLSKIMRDDLCGLGKWLNGPAQAYFGANNKGIETLSEQHSHLHTAAGFVVKKIQDNDLDAAKKVMDGEFRIAFHEVIRTLNVLNTVLTTK